MASRRANTVWKRLVSWYGARLAEQYGPTPPPDWCAAIDQADDAALQAGLSQARRDHVQWPPTLGQFEAAIRAASVRPASVDVAAELSRYVMRHRTLTQSQVRGPWSYLARDTGDRDSKGREVREIVGVVVPADGDSPGYRVTVEDMQAGV